MMECGKDVTYMNNGNEKQAHARPSLVDIYHVSIDSTLPLEKRWKKYLHDIQNPTHFRCGPVTVRICFTEDGNYVCSTYAFKSTETCSRHSIKLEDLTDAVLQTIQTQISLVEDMATMIHHMPSVPIVDTQMRQFKRHQEKKQKEIETLEHVIDSLYIDWKSESLSKTDYFRMKARFEQQLKQLKNTLKQIEIEMHATQQKQDTTTAYVNTFLKHQNIQKLDRPLLIELVDYIHIHEHQTITIHFTFKDQHQYIMEAINQKKVKHMTH